MILRVLLGCTQMRAVVTLGVGWQDFHLVLTTLQQQFAFFFFNEHLTSIVIYTLF